MIKQHAHFLAGEADHNRDGTFWVKGAGITDINAPAWPALARVVLVTRLELDVEAAAQLHHMAIRVAHERAGELIAWRQPVAVKVLDIEKPIFLNVLGNLEFPVPEPGRIEISATVDEILLPLLRLSANTVPGSGSIAIRRPPPFPPLGAGKRRRRRP